MVSAPLWQGAYHVSSTADREDTRRMGQYTYIGLMTGTSMDAIDAALLDLSDAAPRLVATHGTPLPDALRRQLLAVGAGTGLTELLELDARLGEALANAAIELMNRAGVTSNQVRAIGSHGQTLWHAPDAEHRTTLQAGDPNRIAERTGITVVADFRRRDMAAGGQGAPLAPAFHRAFFGSITEPRAVVNIGGIANVTCLPADTTGVTGFDTGPGNVLLDTWCRQHDRGNYDADGAWAAQARTDPQLLARLRDDQYFRRPPPKSTGREYFNAQWLATAKLEGHSPATVQATLAELTAGTIADSLRSAMPSAKRLLVCGGGARNGDLMRRLARNLPEMVTESTADHGISPDWVEAAGFAWLAHATLDGRPGNIPAVTGAHRPVPLGGIYPGGTS